MIRLLKRYTYYIFFSLFKWIKYPTCRLYTNHIHPQAKIGKYVIIEKNCKIDRKVEIGDYTFINENTRIDFNCKSVGKYCSISHGVKLGLGSHPLNLLSTSPVFYSKSRKVVRNDTYDEISDKGYSRIGNDVLIGANALILAGITVHDGAVIAAGSVVTKDVPPYAIVAGNPAKIIKYRFSEEEIFKLLLINWWDKPIRDIIAYTKDYKGISEIIDKLNDRKI